MIVHSRGGRGINNCIFRRVRAIVSRGGFNNRIISGVRAIVSRGGIISSTISRVRAIVLFLGTANSQGDIIWIST